MQRLLVPAVFLFVMVLAVAAPLTTRPVSAAVPAAPTFNKDVLPILQKNCQECHRPGAIAPMSFLTFQDTRPYARAIAKAVAARTMPPWFADPTIGHFENAKVLSARRDRDDCRVGREGRASKATRRTGPLRWCSTTDGRSASPTSS